MTIAAQLIVQTVSVDRLQDPTPRSGRSPSSHAPSTAASAPSSRCARTWQQARIARLVAGSLQTLPNDAKMLLNVERNTGGNKRAVKMPKNGKAIVDAQIPNWRSLTGVTEILEAYYDERDPLHFEVYPPATTSGASLEIVYAVYPTDISIPPAAPSTPTSAATSACRTSPWARRSS
jgi:hypothetical protein